MPYFTLTRLIPNIVMVAKKKAQSRKTGLSINIPVIKKTGRKRATVVHEKVPKPGKSDRWVSVKTPAARPAQQVHVDDAGRIVVPARFRKSLGLKPGDPVTVTLEGDVLRVRTIQATLEKARAIMRKKNPKKRSLVDELIAERRAEAAKE